MNSLLQEDRQEEIIFLDLNKPMRNDLNANIVLDDEITLSGSSRRKKQAFITVVE